MNFCKLAKLSSVALIMASAANAENVLRWTSHGDTVPLQTGDWYEGINPSELKVIGDKIYGRGVADNKGQHFINLMALLSVLKTKKKLGFNLKLIFEMGEEIGSPGLFELCELYKEDLKSDVLIASDGPRVSVEVPTIF